MGHYENTLLTIQCDLKIFFLRCSHELTTRHPLHFEIWGIDACGSGQQWEIALNLMQDSIMCCWSNSPTGTCSVCQWRIWNLSYLSQMPSVGLLWRPHVLLEQLGHCSFGEGHDCGSGKKYGGMNANILCSLWIAFWCPFCFWGKNAKGLTNPKVFSPAAVFHCRENVCIFSQDNFFLW